MKSLQKIIRTHLWRLTLAMMAVILLFSLGLQMLTAQSQARENARVTFMQISQLLRQNEQELENVQEAYRETCLLNAETIAYMIQSDPGLLGDVQTFREVAYKLQVDEIHIFDETGCIFTGTHPEYFNYTFDSGEQMNFFKPMLKDKSLRLCQDITPNTAEGKLVQYSALWSSDENFIVQVGMYPDAVLEVTAKNELSYIFSLLQGSPGISLYAIETQSGQIVGSSSGQDVGTPMEQIGFSVRDLDAYKRGKHVMVNGVNSYCIFEDAEGTLIGYVVSNDSLYSGIGADTMVLALGLAIIAVVLVLLVQRLTMQYTVDSISNINAQLRSIASGKLDERMDERSSQEFSELSYHINQMVQYLLATTEKMSVVLNRTNLRIGVYEYNTSMKNVLFTEHVPKIFGLNPREMQALAADQSQLKAFIERVCVEPVPERENTYRFMGKEEMFLTLEEVTNGSDVLGIVIDVTEEMRSIKRIEAERDIDLLTGLYNRRGMMNKLGSLFEGEKALGYGAIVVLDSDDLKEVNDTYGHLTGDEYLKKLAYLLREFTAPQQFAARMGGDEFLLMIHGYDSEDAVKDALERLRFLQQNTWMHLEDGRELLLRFSYGYVFTHGREDYHTMITEADGFMYKVKRMRKQEGKNAQE